MSADPIEIAPASALSEAGLETILGDPHDAANPFGYARILRADEDGTLDVDAEARLEGWGMNAEFVPRALGGRWDTVGAMIGRLRPLFRRDAALGIGHGVSSLVAAINVWAAGSPDQQREMSDLLLGGGKVAAAYHELEHGNDFLRNAFQARADDTGGLVLDGVKQVINNAGRAAAWIVFARTDARAGGRSHSILMLDRTRLRHELDAGRLAVLPRHRTAGIRACDLAGLRFSGCRVPADRIIATRGSGVEISLRAFQVTRVALPGMAIGMLDTALRNVVEFACARTLYGSPVIALPQVRSLLAEAWLNLTTADCLVRAAARGLHLAPAHASVHAAAVKYLVPHLLVDGMHVLSVVLGARAYLRDGRHAIFGKMMRDMPVVSVAHAGGVACLLTILAQLPALARRAGAGRDQGLRGFDTRAPLPPLDFAALTLVAHGGDWLLDALPDARDALSLAGAAHAPAAGLAAQLTETLDAFRVASAALPPSETGPNAHPDSFALAQRYAWLAAAAACAGVGRAALAGGESSWAADPVWLVAALSRLSRRVGRPQALLSVHIVDALVAGLVARTESNRSFCLHHDTLNGGGHVHTSD